MPETIGFIGLGLIGRPMAANLLKAGYPVVVHSRSEDDNSIMAKTMFDVAGVE